MALAECRECGKEVSNSAKLCPHCGVSQPGKSKAQEMFVGALALIAMLALIGWVSSWSGYPEA
jgi:hypothetical protein